MVALSPRTIQTHQTMSTTQNPFEGMTLKQLEYQARCFDNHNEALPDTLKSELEKHSAEAQANAEARAEYEAEANVGA